MREINILGLAKQVICLRATVTSILSLFWGLAAWSTAGYAQSVAVTHCQGLCPEYTSGLSATRANVVIHHLYASGLNGDTGLADWVAYRLTPDAIGVASLLPRSWQPDRLVNFSPIDDILEVGESELRLTEIASSSNNPYAGLNEPLADPEQRARLAPMTSFANTPYWPDLNNLSNMVPMPSPLRLGPWLRLEQRLNRIVSSGQEVYVITGPLYLVSNLSLTPSSSELNPAAYYKVVSDGEGIAAFVFPENLKQHESFCDNGAKLDEIESMLGLTLFPEKNSPQVSPQLLKSLGCSQL